MRLGPGSHGRAWFYASAGRLGRRLCAVLIIPLLLSLLVSCERPTRSLVLISIDTMRRDHLGVYGYEQPTTPHIDEIAGRGVVFEDALAQAISTPPSHASMLTGLNPPSHGLRKLFGQRLADENLTLAEILRDKGFVTAAFVSGLPLVRAAGLDQGFMFYEDSFQKFARERKAERTNVKVRNWLPTRPEGPVFLWVHYFDPHSPYYAPDEFRLRFGVGEVRKKDLLSPVNHNPLTGAPGRVPEKQIREMSALYDAELSYADQAVGGLMNLLKETGILEDAIVAIVSDHGECLGENGYYFGHWDVFDATARIPMILLHPDGRWAGQRVRGPVATVDLMPTLLAWLGIAPPEGLDGRDLTPSLNGGAWPDRKVYTEQLEYFFARSVRDRNWILTERYRGKKPGVGAHLGFRPRIGSAKPLDQDEEAARTGLEQALDQLGKPRRGPSRIEETSLRKLEEGLRALGYVGD